jgi:hypothetical protein
VVGSYGLCAFMAGEFHEKRAAAQHGCGRCPGRGEASETGKPFSAGRWVARTRPMGEALSGRRRKTPDDFASHASPSVAEHEAAGRRGHCRPSSDGLRYSAACAKPRFLPDQSSRVSGTRSAGDGDDPLRGAGPPPP